jgi:hypothetical protein
MVGMARYQVRLVGREARLGEVPAVDVARLIFGVQRAVARAAGSAIGRRPKPTGRWETTLEEATKLRLVRIRRGSVILELDPPHEHLSDDELRLDVDSLGDIGWSTTVAAINGAESADPDITSRLLRLADELNIGTRFDAVEFRTDGKAVGRIDRVQREHFRSVLRAKTSSPTPPDGVTGVLFEADFERHTAKVRTQTGGVVEVIFDDDQADGIKEALREASEFEGDVIFDAVTATVRSIRLRRISRFEQLLLGEDGARAFWERSTFDQLARRQGTAAVETFDELKDGSLKDEEFATFIATLS